MLFDNINALFLKHLEGNVWLNHMFFSTTRQTFSAAHVGSETMLGLLLTLVFSFPLSADSKPEEQPVSSESLRESLKKELEFYFSR